MCRIKWCCSLSLIYGMKDKTINKIVGLFALLYSFSANPHLSFTIIIVLFIFFICLNGLFEKMNDGMSSDDMLNMNNNINLDTLSEIISFLFMCVCSFIALVVSLFGFISLL